MLSYPVKIVGDRASASLESALFVKGRVARFLLRSAAASEAAIADKWPFLKAIAAPLMTGMGASFTSMAKEFSNRSKRLDMIAKDLEHCQHRYGKKGTRKSPEPSPKAQA